MLEVYQNNKLSKEYSPAQSLFYEYYSSEEEFLLNQADMNNLFDQILRIIEEVQDDEQQMQQILDYLLSEVDLEKYKPTSRKVKACCKRDSTIHGYGNDMLSQS